MSKRVNLLSVRYATALFSISAEKKLETSVAKELDAVSALINGSDLLAKVLDNPIVSRSEQVNLVASLAKKLKLSQLVARFILVLAENRRLNLINDIKESFNSIWAKHRGEVVAEMVTAIPVAKADVKAVEATLKKILGANVLLDSTVDEKLIGGMVVKIGSTMIDSSIKGRLERINSISKDALVGAF